EVRFRDSREVHQAVRHAIEHTLAAPRAEAAVAGAIAPAEARLSEVAQPVPAWTQPAMRFESREPQAFGHQVQDLAALWQSPQNMLARTDAPSPADADPAHPPGKE